MVQETKKDDFNFHSKSQKYLSIVNTILDSPVYLERLQNLGMNKDFFLKRCLKA